MPAIVVGLACAQVAAWATTGPLGSPTETPRQVVTAQPPEDDPRWQLDDQGRAYYLDPLPRAHARRISETEVRTVWGFPVDVEREDDEFFYVKIYRVAPVRRPTVAPRPPIPDVALEPSDRLRLEPFGAGLPVGGQWREGFAVADMNGDGHLDIASGPPRKSLGPPVVLLGDGMGAWKVWREARFPSLAYDYGDAQAGDLDGDGHMDLVLGVHLRGLMALTGDGRGGFTDRGHGLDFAAKAGDEAFSSRAIGLLDWNGDGRLDIVALGEGPRPGLVRGGAAGAGGGSRGLVVYVNGGASPWRPEDGTAAENPGFGSSLAVGDFDGDGRMDVATASAVLGRTDLVHFATDASAWRSAPIAGVPARAYVRAVAASDFDGDGRDDLALAYTSFERETPRAGIDVLFLGENGEWQRVEVAGEAGRELFTALGTGDLDGDGHPDLVALSDAGDVLLFPGGGNRTFTREPPVPGPIAGGCRGTHVELVDLDRDGRDDIIAGFADEATMGDPSGCPSQGGLAAWRSAPVEH